MTDNGTLLPSWRTGEHRDRLIDFLDAAESLPVEQRVAAFDNDGTLWCERPTLVQFDFFADALATATVADPSLAARPEFAAVLDGDAAAIGELGLERVALALAELFADMEPDEFVRRSREFMHRAQHRSLGIPLMHAVYQPMLELLDELQERAFTVAIVSGGGTEFVRAVSQELYGITPEAVVGTQIAYSYSRRATGQPVLRRTAQVSSVPNEGGREGEPHPGATRSPPDLRRRQLRWRPGDDGMGVLR